MKFKVAITLTALISLCQHGAVALEDSPDTVFKQIQTAANEYDWQALLSLMTPSAAETMVQGEITSAAMAIDREFPPGPKGDRNRQRIEEVFAKHNVDSIKRPASPDFTKGTPGKKVLDRFAHEKRQFVNQVIDRLDNRIQFLNDLSQVLADSPTPLGSTIALRLGEIARIKVEGSSATAMIEVDPSRLSDDPTVMNIMPPTPVLFHLDENGAWKYAGIDQVKQKEIAERHLDLWKREQTQRKSDEPRKASLAKSGDVRLIANWVPFDDESTYGFAKKWPEINQMEPVSKNRFYEDRFFQSMVPKENTKVGEVWEIDENALLPLLKQFHEGASCKLHHGGPTGAYGCLLGQKGELLSILVRLHGEIRHENGWYYTVSQFEGHLVWNGQTNKVKSFRLFVPPIRTNVDVNRSATPEEIRNKVKYKGLTGVDIGFTPLMELATEPTLHDIEWDTTLELDRAKDLLAKKFYRSSQINWIPWEDAVSQSRESGRPLLVVALFGTLNDESC